MTRFEPFLLSAARIVIGFLFLQHGAQKLFGALGGDQVANLISMRGLAGILEFFGGLLIMLGLFTRPTAFVLAGQMAVAYFMVHASQDFWPIQNGGELAAFYSFVFLYLSARGAGPWSLDALLGRAPRMEPRPHPAGVA